jgi:phage gp45-like
VTVEKDSGAFLCDLSLTIDATSSSASVTDATLSGGFPCALIDVAEPGTVSVSGNNVTFTGLTITPPLSPGQCNGPITVAWGGNSASPRTLTASIPLSNSTATSGADCEIDGVLSQTSSPALDIN